MMADPMMRVVFQLRGVSVDAWVESANSLQMWNPHESWHGLNEDLPTRYHIPLTKHSSIILLLHCRINTCHSESSTWLISMGESKIKFPTVKESLDSKVAVKYGLPF